MKKLLHIWVNYRNIKKPWYVDLYLDHNRQFFDEVLSIHDNNWECWLDKALQNPVFAGMWKYPDGNSRFDAFRVWYLMNNPETWFVDSDLKIISEPNIHVNRPAFAAHSNGRLAGFFQYSGIGFSDFWEKMLKRMSEVKPGHTSIQTISIPQNWDNIISSKHYVHNSPREKQRS